MCSIICCQSVVVVGGVPFSISMHNSHSVLVHRPLFASFPAHTASHPSETACTVVMWERGEAHPQCQSGPCHNDIVFSQQRPQMLFDREQGRTFRCSSRILKLNLCSRMYLVDYFALALTWKEDEQQDEDYNDDWGSKIMIMATLIEINRILACHQIHSRHTRKSEERKRECCIHIRKLAYFVSSDIDFTKL